MLTFIGSVLLNIVFAIFIVSVFLAAPITLIYLMITFRKEKCYIIVLGAIFILFLLNLGMTFIELGKNFDEYKYSITIQENK